ncbi:hypothetical protein AMTR_s00067p00119190 [Amborella trichopoda]|uniref:Uncharacterized protein n=1 Tax=Amborella trichopoda TaxID=13333 RepID=U5DBM2_AMBTC|nr:hypothetical protein AMTR_s00067p00119190 [Amborella trichopoda]
MCVTTLIFDDIVESYMLDRVCCQFRVKQGIPRNHLSVDKRSNRHGGQRDWQNVNSDKIHHWLSRHDHMMTDIEVDIANGLPLEEYKAWLVQFRLVDMKDIQAMMELLQREVNEEAVQEEGGQDVVGESSWIAVDDLAPSTQYAVEERRRHNMRQKQYWPKRRWHP